MQDLAPTFLGGFGGFGQEFTDSLRTVPAARHIFLKLLGTAKWKCAGLAIFGSTALWEARDGGLQASGRHNAPYGHFWLDAGQHNGCFAGLALKSCTSANAVSCIGPAISRSVVFNSKRLRYSDQQFLSKAKLPMPTFNPFVDKAGAALIERRTTFHCEDSQLFPLLRGFSSECPSYSH